MERSDGCEKIQELIMSQSPLSKAGALPKAVFKETKGYASTNSATSIGTATELVNHVTKTPQDGLC